MTNAKHRRLLSAVVVLIAIGTVIGLVAAYRVQMTSMPEMVALFNGFGGGASVLVAGGALVVPESVSDAPPLQMAIATVTSGLIGAWSDRFGRRVIMIGGMLILGAGYIALGFAGSVPELIVVRVFITFGIASVSVSARPSWR